MVGAELGELTPVCVVGGAGAPWLVLLEPFAVVSLNLLQGKVGRACHGLYREHRCNASVRLTHSTIPMSRTTLVRD